MMKFMLFFMTFTLLSATVINDKPAYVIFDAEGDSVDYKKMFKKVKKADMTFFGELHNNPIAHWLQYELTVDLFDEHKEDLVLGAEMFESDNQLILTEYLKGMIAENKFEEECRLWNNYKTDYKPLVLFAKEKKLPFIATNIPRRYANVVYKEGLEALNQFSQEAKSFIAPLPIQEDLTVNCYKEMLEMGGGNKKFPQAQMVKDATMAHFTLKNWEKGKAFLHFNGSFHSDKHEGIIWYIKQKNKDLDIVTISVVEQQNLDKLEAPYLGKSDFIIVVNKNMTKTY